MGFCPLPWGFELSCGEEQAVPAPWVRSRQASHRDAWESEPLETSVIGRVRRSRLRELIANRAVETQRADPNISPIFVFCSARAHVRFFAR